jgi:hypothetical protein
MTNQNEACIAQPVTVLLPKEGTVDVIALQPGQSFSFNFGQADIQSMSIGLNGELIVELKNNAKVVIENYATVAAGDADRTVQLADGSSVNLGQMFPGLETLCLANHIDPAKIAAAQVADITPAAGVEETVTVAKVAEETVDVKVVKAASVKAEETAKTEAVQKEVPAKEMKTDSEMASVAEQLQEIAPAAGEGGGAISVGGGFGFSSPLARLNFDAQDAIGAIGATSLNYSAPEPQNFGGSSALPPTPPASPTLGAQNVQFFEDGTIGTSMNASPAGAGDSLTLTLTGIAPGWSVDTTTSGGTYDAATGTWTLNLPAGTSFSGGPKLIPIKDADADLDLVFTATATNSFGLSTSSSTNFAVILDAVADEPVMTVSNAAGNEDTAIALNIAAAVSDTDGSESITGIVISGVPVGATLSAGTFDAASNTWSLTPAQLVGLTLTPPAQFSGTLNLKVGVTVFDQPTDTEVTLTNNTLTRELRLTVTVNAVADQPSLQVRDVTVLEDQSVQLNVSAALADTDGSERLTVTIAGIQAGWTVDTSTSGGTYNAATGTWSLTLPQGVNSFSGGPVVRPPVNSDVDMRNLTVTATATETANGATSSATATMNVVVDAVVDNFSLNATNASGNEDSAIALNISAGLTDLDSSERVTAITITGVPVGATLSAGTFDAASNTWSLTPAQLVGLTLTPPAQFSGTLNLKAVADQPSLQVRDVTVLEDQSVQLNVSAALADTDGSERLTVTIAGIQAGWTVDTSTSGGTYNAATGTWSLTLPQGVNSFSGGPVVRPPVNSDVDMRNLTVTATATETANGATSSATATMNVVVDAVVDNFSFNATNATGNQGSPIALNITSALGDTDGSERITGILIKGVPVGATLSAGTFDPPTGYWALTPAQLTGLTLTPPASFNGTLNLSVQMSVFDRPTDNELTLSNNTLVKEVPLSVTIYAPVLPPYLDVKNLCVMEDNSIRTDITALVHTQSPDNVLSIVMTGIPAGWTVNTSTSGGTYNAATGTWTLTLPAGTGTFTGGPTLRPPANSDVDLTGISVRATTTNIISGGSTDTVKTFDIYVDAVADTPNLSVAGVIEANSANVAALRINTSTADRDGSEVISSVRVSGVPDGFTLSAGMNLGGGVWSLTQAQLSGLTIKPPSTDYKGQFFLTITSTTTETRLSGVECELGNNEASRTVQTCIVYKGIDVAQAPEVTVADLCIKEDGAMAVQINARLTDRDGSETLTVTMTGIPAGWTVDTSTSGGTYNAATGTWSLALARGVTSFTGGPTLRPPANSDADISSVRVTATARETATGDIATASATFKVVVDAVADAPAVNVSSIVNQHWNIFDAYKVPLSINAAVTDKDGSEQITKIVIRLDQPISKPVGTFVSLHTMGVTLDKGVQVAPGVWEVTVNNADAATALSGLNLLIPVGGRAFYDTIHEALVGGQKATVLVETHVREVHLSGAECTLDNNATFVTSTVGFNFYITPLVLDLGRNGFDLVSAGVVSFDMDNDGIADKTSWVAAEDGLLVLDRNGDGTINNQSELFGNTKEHAEGFANLASFDANKDGVIDANDAIFAELKIWQDLNQDGISQVNELLTLDQLGVASINLNAETTNQVVGDSLITLTSSFAFKDGSQGVVADVLFNFESGDVADASAQTASLPSPVLSNWPEPYVNGGGEGPLTPIVSNDPTPFDPNAPTDDPVLTPEFSNWPTPVESGDVLDIRNFVGDRDVVSEGIHNFVKTVEVGANTVVQVDKTGTGTHFQDVYVLENTKATVDDLLASNSLLTH